ncbi:Fur family transcriptional regulator [Spelaeicoccus albus]|uniref:Fe2+ or Zn2+ uptake regulation protein n=1 Tax=Spelaeicoccus albus TaxID=1280376 RepID=A0A7Z0D508_9MICO|nr:Fur family transcriptional regulator [Spelaeicoccus albus]NYI68926.1 Fe2+ or Zn2+ uptake regulation protein [Spelaeicoccus albus]
MSTPQTLSTAELAERLRSAGLRSTGPRRAVYSALAELGGHRSADEVLEYTARSGPALPRASVYNALGTLVSIGLVIQAEAGSGVALYEVASDYHHHLLCRGCGRIVDVPAHRSDAAAGVTDPPGEALFERLPGALIESAQIVYRGLCPECNAKSHTL